MANAHHTRPPNRPHNHGRRPPRGPRRLMPLTPRQKHWKNDIDAAAAKLVEVGEPGLAQSVSDLFTRSGQMLVSKIYREQMEARGAVGVTLTIGGMRKAEIDHLKRQAKRRARTEEGYTLSAEGEKGLKAFADGELTPVQPERAAWGSGASDDTKNLTLRVDGELLDTVRKLGKKQAAELGWTPTPATVVKQWLRTRFRMPDAD